MSLDFRLNTGGKIAAKPQNSRKSRVSLTGTPRTKNPGNETLRTTNPTTKEASNKSLISANQRRFAWQKAFSSPD